MPVPIVYRKSGEGAIASYPYSEIAEGTGYVEYDLFTSREASTLSPRLATTIGATETQYTRVGVDVGTQVFGNFDLSAFNAPKTIKGNAIFYFTWRCWKDGSTGSVAGRLKFEVCKYSGTTETVLATGYTVTMTVSNSAPYTGTRTSVLIIPITETDFRRGDILRVRITGEQTGSYPYNFGFELSHNPRNQNYSTYFVIGTTGAEASSTNSDYIQCTEAKAYIPFRIDT